MKRAVVMVGDRHRASGKLQVKNDSTEKKSASALSMPRIFWEAKPI
jgi:hypothetical protein